MVFLQALLIGLTALILAPGYSFYFDVTPKLVILLAGTAVLLAWSAVRYRAAPRSFSMVMLLTLASLAVSSAASDHPALSVFGTIWRRYGALPQAVLLLFAWMVAAQTSGRLDRVRTILRGIVVSGVLGAAYGICQYAGWDPLLSPARYHIGEGIWTIVRPPGTMGYVSYFASWLLITVFLSLTLASLEESRWWRRFAYFSAALSLTAMALTGTRAALAGLAAGAVVALYLRGSFRISRRVVALAAACGDRGGRILVQSRGLELAQPGAMVCRRPVGRRPSAALAGQSADGFPPSRPGFRAGDLPGIFSAVRIDGAGARLSRLHARIASQHVPGFADRPGRARTGVPGPPVPARTAAL